MIAISRSISSLARLILSISFWNGLSDLPSLLDMLEPLDHLSERVTNFLLENPDIDGIFTINDPMALAVIDMLEKIGKNVPEDVQVIGFDGIKMSVERNTPVTTIRQPLELMAQKAVELIVQKIAGESLEKLQYVLPVSYVEGPTTKN